MGRFIGIFGGSFDPIHNGHLNLAIEMMEAHHLDEVWFCPTGCSPYSHKDRFLANARHRLNMIKLAIVEEPRFRISEIELKREGISYTIDTLNELHEAQRDRQDPDSFALILGEDSACNFFKWQQAEAIVKAAKLLIGKRADARKEPEPFQGSPAVVEALNQGMTSTRMIEISSQEIRQRLLNKKYCYHLLPTKVMDYIITNHLYLVH